MPEGTLQLEHLMQATKLLQLKKASLADIEIIFDGAPARPHSHPPLDRLLTFLVDRSVLDAHADPDPEARRQLCVEQPLALPRPTRPTLTLSTAYRLRRRLREPDLARDPARRQRSCRRRRQERPPAPPTRGPSRAAPAQSCIVTEALSPMQVEEAGGYETPLPREVTGIETVRPFSLS